MLSLYLLSPRLTALLLLVLPALVSAGAALGSVLRALSRRAQEQVMGGRGATDGDPHPCGAPRSAAMSPSAQVAKATGVADEVLGNVRTVRAFAMEEQQAG